MSDVQDAIDMIECHADFFDDVGKHGMATQLRESLAVVSGAISGSSPRVKVQGPDACRETDALVDRFADALKAKLRASEAKYGWQNGWIKPDWREDCQRDLARHVAKGDPLDVAAYAAFCWHHGWPTALATLSPKEQP